MDLSTSGSELETRLHVGDLDLDGLTPLLTLSCQLRWMSLPAKKIRIPFIRVCAAFSADRHAEQRKNPSLTTCHSPWCLERWLTATVKPARARAALRVAELAADQTEDRASPIAQRPS